MNQQKPNKFYDEAVQLWMHQQTIGFEENPPNRNDYPDDDAVNKSFARTAIEAITQGANFKAQIDALDKQRSPKQFYEIAVSFEDLAIKKMELGFLSRHINIRETYLICDRLFVDLSRHKIGISDLHEYIRHTAIANNLISLKDFRVVECDWIEDLIDLLYRDPLASNLRQSADRDPSSKRTFDELLATVVICKHQENLQLQQQAIDIMNNAPPPIVIIKDEAEIERLRLQYSPKDYNNENQ